MPRAWLVRGLRSLPLWLMNPSGIPSSACMCNVSAVMRKSCAVPHPTSPCSTPHRGGRHYGLDDTVEKPFNSATHGRGSEERDGHIQGVSPPVR